MARRTTMSWEPRTRRWWKQHLGKRFYISCRQLKKTGYLPLDAPETKEGSRDAANRWLADQLTTVAPCRFDHLIKMLEERKRFCESHPDEYLGRYANAVANAIDMLREIAVLDSKTPLGELAQYVPAAEAVHSLVNHDADLWADRVRFLKPSFARQDSGHPRGAVLGSHESSGRCQEHLAV